MPRIVLDTNSPIQCLPKKSKYHVAWQSLEEGSNTLCVSNDILEEYVEIMQRLISYEAAEYFIKAIVNTHLWNFTPRPMPFSSLTQTLMTTNSLIVPLRPEHTASSPMTIITMCSAKFHSPK